MPTWLLQLIKKPLFWAFLVAFLAICYGGVQRYRADRLKTENEQLLADKERLTNNVNILSADVETYKTKANDNAASVAALSMTVAELKQANGKVSKELQALQVKYKDLQQYAEAATKTTVEVETVVHDTVYMGESHTAFNWSDRWVSVAGVIDGESVTCRVSSVDTLVQVVHRIPRRFLFFRFGTKGLKQDIVSKNPHTAINYAEYVEICK